MKSRIMTATTTAAANKDDNGVGAGGPASRGFSVTGLMASFAAREVGVTALYVLSLLASTILSLVALTRITAATYNVITAGDHAGAIKHFCILAVAMVGVMGLNALVDGAEAVLVPRFAAHVQDKLVTAVVKSNERDFLNIDPSKYRHFVRSGVTAGGLVFKTIVRTIVPNGLLLVVLACFLATIDAVYVGIIVAACGTAGAAYLLSRRSINAQSMEAQRQNDLVEGMTSDVFASLDTVVSRGQSEAELASLRRSASKAAAVETSFLGSVNLLSYATYAAMIVAILACIFVALDKVSHGNSAAQTAAIALTFTLMSTMRVKMQGIATANALLMEEGGRFASTQIPALFGNEQLTPSANPSSVPASMPVDGPPPLRVPPSSSAPFAPLLPWSAPYVPITADDDVATPIVEFRQVSYAYTDKSATAGDIAAAAAAGLSAAEPVETLSNFNWSVGPGISGLFGPSGAGKSTVADLMGGLYSSGYTGDILINGRNALNDKQLLRRTVLVSQQQMRVLNRSLRDVLTYGTGASDEAVKAVWNDIRDVYEPQLTLDSMVGVGGANLSTGQLQLLRMASVRLSPHPIVVLDEPTNGVDVQRKPAVLAAIRKLGQEKQAVVLVTHDQETAALAQHVTFLSRPLTTK